MKATQLSDAMIRCIAPAERKKMKLKTAEEAIAAVEIKSEKQLQKQIIALLNLKGIEVNVSRMDKRKTDRVGWPDLTFSITGDLRAWEWGSESLAWEVKLPRQKLTKEQQDMFDKLSASPNGWTCEVIHSVDEAIAKLEAMGVT